MDENNKLREEAIKKAIDKIRERFSIGDYEIIEELRTYNTLEKVINQLYERLADWISIYKKVESKNQIAFVKRVIEELNSDSDFILKPSNEEKENIIEVGNEILRLNELREQLENKIIENVKKLMPNTSYIIDPIVAASLLERAGSFEKLANLPASTIQLLGAEKALFKHIKFKTKSPKHGVLFKEKEISTASKKERGRLARMFANKISIALRADFYTKRFIGDKLKKDLEERIKK